MVPHGGGQHRLLLVSKSRKYEIDFSINNGLSRVVRLSSQNLAEGLRKPSWVLSACGSRALRAECNNRLRLWILDAPGFAPGD